MIYLPTALLLSWGFYVAVEEPFMRMSRSIKKKEPYAIPVQYRAGENTTASQ
jgi:hypothetical protein